MFFFKLTFCSLKFNGSGEGDAYQAMTYAGRLSMRPAVAKVMILASCRLINKAILFLLYCIKNKQFLNKHFGLLSKNFLRYALFLLNEH
jgi:hypothetical protein